MIFHDKRLNWEALFNQFKIVGASALIDRKKWPRFICTRAMAREMRVGGPLPLLSNLVQNHLGIVRSQNCSAEYNAADVAHLWLQWIGKSSTGIKGQLLYPKKIKADGQYKSEQ